MNVKRLKAACYTSNITMSVVGNMPPILLLTFRSMFGISYSLLGTLLLINFVTQLCVDLVFSFFSHRFNIPRTVRLMPLIGVVGLVLYAAIPTLAPGLAYPGLVLGTILFSGCSGLAEVLLSPIIAALPAKDPDREMSKLHSVYAWGAVAVILGGTCFLLLFGQKAWPWLVLLLALIPLTSAALFAGTEIPELQTQERISGVMEQLRSRRLWMCFLAIFLGGAAECTMAQWCSGYAEGALGISKVWGDVFGAALFALMLGMGRTLYAKFGKNLGTIMLLGVSGAALCYLLAAVSGNPVLSLVACAMTGFCVSMLWPGCLVVASDFLPSGGVLLYAMMAAGGDFGASAGPQIIGVVTDLAIASPRLCGAAAQMGLQPDQLGMKLGMLTGALFPLCGIGLYAYILYLRKKESLE